MTDLEAKITREAVGCLDHLQGHVLEAKQTVVVELEMKEWDFEFTSINNQLKGVLNTLKSRLYDHHQGIERKPVKVTTEEIELP